MAQTDTIWVTFFRFSTLMPSVFKISWGYIVYICILLLLVIPIRDQPHLVFYFLPRFKIYKREK